MADLPSRQTFFDVGRRSIVTTPGLRINPRVVDVQGSDLNILIGAMALMAEEATAAFAACFQNLFVETASVDGLDRVAFDRYQLTRLPATPATVNLVLTRATAAFGAFTYPGGSRVQTAAGTQFATDNDAVFGTNDKQLSISATALIAGPDSNVAAGTLTQFVDQPADGTLTVRNDGGAAGGTDAESDPDFRARILAFFPTIRRGVIGAIEFGAIQVPGVAVAKAIEIINTTNAMPAAIVELIIGDKNGGASTPMLQAVRDNMLTFRAAGIPVNTIAGVPTFQAVQWDLAFETGVDQQLVEEQVRAITVAVAQFLRPNDTLYVSSLIAAARQVPGAVVAQTALKLPLGDVVPTSTSQIIRIRPEDVIFV